MILFSCETERGILLACDTTFLMGRYCWFPMDTRALSVARRPTQNDPLLQPPTSLINAVT